MNEPALDARQKAESSIIRKLMRMKSWAGIIDEKSDVVIPWKIGISKVNLEIFLRGAEKYYAEKQGIKGEGERKKGFLYIPSGMPVHLPDHDKNPRKTREAIKYIEENYHIHCMRGNFSIENVLAVYSRRKIRKSGSMNNLLL
jgi:hypothetical protein